MTQRGPSAAARRERGPCWTPRRLMRRYSGRAAFRQIPTGAVAMAQMHGWWPQGDLEHGPGCLGSSSGHTSAAGISAVAARPNETGHCGAGALPRHQGVADRQDTGILA